MVFVKTVLHFMASGKISARQKLQGVFESGREHAWDVQVIAAANRSKMNIPEDIAVVGVDNDELICENTNPTLSSVMPDFHSAGKMAAEMLKRRITNPKMRPITETFGPLDLDRRAKALELLSDPSHDRTSIANRCGYSSANALMNFLRKASAEP